MISWGIAMPPRTIIYVEGIIGAGKSTFINELSKRIPSIVTHQEPVDSWVRCGIFNRFYSDMKRWATSFQLKVLFDKVRAINSMTDDAGIHVVERSVYSDACFVNTVYKFGFVDDFEYALIEEARNTCEVKHLPDAIIYIRPDLDTCMTRATSRGRDGENNVTREYQMELMKHHDDMFHKHKMTTQGGTKIPIVVLADNDVDDRLITHLKCKIPGLN